MLLVSAPWRGPANHRAWRKRDFGQFDQDGQRFPVDVPYPADLIVAIASSAPLFRTVRPPEEMLDSYLRELRNVLHTATVNGVRVSAAVMLVWTSAH